MLAVICNLLLYDKCLILEYLIKFSFYVLNTPNLLVTGKLTPWILYLKLLHNRISFALYLSMSC